MLNQFVVSTTHKTSTDVLTQESTIGAGGNLPLGGGSLAWRMPGLGGSSSFHFKVLKNMNRWLAIKIVTHW